MWHRVQVIDNFETRFFTEIVDAGDVEQVIERKLGTGRISRFRGDRLRRLRTSFRHEIQFCAEVSRRRLGLTNRRFLAES